MAFKKKAKPKTFIFIINGFLKKSQAKNVHFYYKFIYEFIYPFWQHFFLKSVFIFFDNTFF